MVESLQYKVIWNVFDYDLYQIIENDHICIQKYYFYQTTMFLNFLVCTL